MLQFGLNGIPGDGRDSWVQIPKCKEMLALNHEREHYVTGKAGAPGVYIFDDLKWFLWEIGHYINEPYSRFDRKDKRRIASERPLAVDDHLMTCFRMMCCDVPHFIRGFNDNLEVKNSHYFEVEEKEYCFACDEITGY
jgi:hypothetical protein